MSGGSYDYMYGRIEELAEQVKSRATGGPVDQRPLRLAFATLLLRVSKAAFELEWADSGDTDYEESARPVLQELLAPSLELDAAVQMAKEARDALMVALARAGS